MGKILGLDASTSTAGVSILEDGKILEFSWIDLKKKETIKEKVNLIVDSIKSHSLFKEVNKINLESAVSGFGMGFSSQQTIILLSRFNAVLEYVISEHPEFKHIKLELMGATTARKRAFGKSIIKGIKPKDYVKMQLDLRFDLKPFIKMNRNGDPDKRNEDAMDALVLALAG